MRDSCSICFASLWRKIAIYFSFLLLLLLLLPGCFACWGRFILGATGIALLIRPCPPGVLPTTFSASDSSVFANVGGNWFSSTATLTTVTVAADGTVNASFLGEPQYGANDRIYVQGDKSLITEPASGRRWRAPCRREHARE